MDIVVGIIGGLLLLWLALLVVFWVFRPRGMRARELAAIVPDIVRLLRSLIAGNDVPLDVRLVCVGLVAWIVSPIDLIPEFIPVLGPLDDVVVAVVAMRFVRRRLGSAELGRRWTGTEAGFALLSRLIGS
jgi:uncharacterized membrane protein YkvA (DUF1232 family)